LYFFQSQQQGPDTILIASAKPKGGKGKKGRGKGKTEEQVLAGPNRDLLVSFISLIIMFRYSYDLLSHRLLSPPF
jgi:hypothetical protein